MKELNALNDIYQNQMYESKKAKKDYDGDGKIESGSKEHAGVVHNAIQKKKGGKPDGQDTRKEAYVTEISANKLIDAAKAAEVKRGKAASAGDRETAKKALSQNKKFYDAAKAKRKNEGVEISAELTKLIESGKFSEKEINLLVWNEFEESREYSHNPEKYHDSEGHDKKLERDKPYRKRSKAARMADPERGINSPAFRKFMADRGM